MDDLPHGDRQEIVTFTVEDRTKMIRGRGMAEAAARALCDRLADDVAAAPLTLLRITYVAFRHQEVVGTFGEMPPSLREEA